MFYVNHTELKIPLFFDQESKRLLFATIPEEGTPCVHILRQQQESHSFETDNLAKNIIKFFEPVGSLPRFNIMLYKWSITPFDNALFEKISSQSSGNDKIRITLKDLEKPLIISKV